MTETGCKAPAVPAGGAVALRKAVMGDLPVLLRLINDNAAQGLMLPRSEFELAENLRDFTVAVLEGQPVGCCALHFYSASMGEIRSLAVDPAARKQGTGRKLVEALVEEARACGLLAVFAFTYIPGFFARLGFREIEREALPLKAWKDCLRCPKFQCCDEIAVVMPLDGPEALAAGGKRAANGEDEAVRWLPVMRVAAGERGLKA
jgi:amino-acid N-acetyltransferase